MNEQDQDAPAAARPLDRSCVSADPAPQAPAGPAEPAGVRGVPAEAWRVVHEVVLLLQKEPEQPWSLEALGRRAGYEPHHLARQFQRVMGVSPLRYLRLLRLERAAHAIEHGSAGSILQAGVDAMFSSAEGFSRAFRRTFGVAPRDYPALLRATMRSAAAPPEGLDPEPKATTLGPLVADSITVPSFEPRVVDEGVAALHRHRPFDGPWQLGGVAQPWGWGPRQALRELRMLRLVPAGAPAPPPPLARWRLEAHDFYEFGYHGSLAGTGLACGWLMTIWMASRRKAPAYGPVIVVTEQVEAPTRARIYIPRRPR